MASISGTVSVTKNTKPAKKAATLNVIDGTITVVNSYGSIVASTYINPDGTYGLSVPIGSNYVVRAVMGNVLLKAFLPNATGNTIGLWVSPFSAAVVKTLGVVAGKPNLGEAGVNSSTALTTINVSNVVSAIGNSGSISALTSALAGNIAADYDPTYMGAPTLGSASTAGDNLVAPVVSDVAAALAAMASVTSTLTSTSSGTGTGTGTGTGIGPIVITTTITNTNTSTLSNTGTNTSSAPVWTGKCIFLAGTCMDFYYNVVGSASIHTFNGTMNNYSAVNLAQSCTGTTISTSTNTSTSTSTNVSAADFCGGYAYSSGSCTPGGTFVGHCASNVSGSTIGAVTITTLVGTWITP